jgi:hypothetical protein
MVINERDILGTQLIKRKEEAKLLKENIEIQSSKMNMGDIYYKEKLQTILELKKKIADLKQ